jgi:quercetin dioxygenase-like cupin family protein
MVTDVVTLGGIEVRYLVDGAAHGGHGMFELTVQPQAHVPPPHSHSDNDEIVYVLEGMLRYSVDAETRDLRAGEWMTSPRGSVHAFSNPFDASARALITLSPDIGKQYFVDAAAAMGSGGPPDRNQLIAIMTRYGLKPAAPRP